MILASFNEINNGQFIDASRPQGTEYVSSIDDFERETRRWIIQCMNVISGYPYVDTVAIKTWNTQGRPDVNSIQRNLLGFNTDTQSLEVVLADGNYVNFAQKIALLVYPVGSYYETSDPYFNPNTAWGGTWVKDSDGKVLVADDTATGFSLDQTGGAKTITISEGQLPPHNHTHTHPHSHTLNSINITGSFGATKEMAERANGAFQSITPTGEDQFYCGLPRGEEASENGRDIRFSTIRGGNSYISGEIDRDQTENSGGTVGQGQPIDIMPPYKVVIRWHRIPDPVEEEENNG